MADDFFRRHPEASMDVVEIDPRMIDIAAQYFFFDKNKPNLNVYHQDARVYLNQSEKKYDVIHLENLK